MKIILLRLARSYLLVLIPHHLLEHMLFRDCMCSDEIWHLHAIVMHLGSKVSSYPTLLNFHPSAPSQNQLHNYNSEDLRASEVESYAPPLSLLDLLLQCSTQYNDLLITTLSA